MIDGINHITISVKDLETSFSFYRDVLKFDPLMKHSKGAYFLAGETWFCLDLDPLTRNAPLPEYTHFAFSVSQENFATVRQRITQAGVKSWQDNSSEGDSLYFLDPDGHKLEIHVGDWRSRIRSAKAKPWNESLQFFDFLKKSLSLEVIADFLAVTKLKPTEPIPDWAFKGSFFSISKTTEELSIVCSQGDVPEGINSDANWNALKVKGPLDFGLTGILSSIAQPLAIAGVSIFAISTFDTDYVLVKRENLERAISTLEQAGHLIVRSK